MTVKRVFFVTTNKGKVESANLVLERYGYEAVQVVDSIEEPEGCGDPKVIVNAKLKHAIGTVNAPTICEDGGFFVKALNGRPGVKVHGYLREFGLNGLLKEMDDAVDRSAYFLGVLAYSEPGWVSPVYFEERVPGRILSSPRGTLRPYSWSELHLVFVPDGETKTIAEMTVEEYQRFRRGVDSKSRFESLGEFLSRPR